MENELLAVERRNRIIETINVNKSIIVSELSRAYSVSEETIRRDLDKLQNQGILIRTYGGAILPNDKKTDFSAKIREGLNTEAKIEIAKSAVELLNEDDSIFIDASSTSYYFSKEIKGMKLTVITNAINVINELVDEKSITLISTGGKLYSNHLALFGSVAKRTIDQFNVSKLFFSCKGISQKAGLTDSDEVIAESHKSMIDRAEEVILLCDSTKFEKVSFVSTTGFKPINIVITEKRLDESWEKFLENNSTKIIYA